MLSLSEVKKHLPSGSTDEDAERIRTELNQIATVLVTEYLAKKKSKG
ncbi:MAG: hypothetical protein HGA87_03010 [Desulfobulbaceae bacterium]|nr:hypothetical protein [Desulfobulbaceae bacterium]